MSNKSLTRRQHTEIFDGLTTEIHEFRLQPFKGIVLEVEDEHFHHDSAVMLPNYPATAQQAVGGPSLGLAVIAACLKHQESHPDQQVLMTGHADTSGPDQYNLAISLKRAKSVKHAVMGERDEWVAIAMAQHKTEDYQLILKWVADLYGWDCDPQGVDNVDGPHTHSAIRNFQNQYNLEFEKSIGTGGVMNAETWGAFFDVYMDMVQDLCETDEAGLAALRGKMKFLGPQIEGCGENWPIDQRGRNNYRSQINRRVEILFFDPGQEPKFDCHPSQTTCTPILCELYNLKMYKFTHLPVVPSPPKPRQVFLKLTYIGPEDEKPEYAFPPGFPVTVVWRDNSTHPVKTAQDGRLQFGIPQNQSPFTIQFDTADTFIAKAPVGSADPDRTAHAADLAALHTGNFRFFKVPEAWTLKQSDWTPNGASKSYDLADCNFTLPVGRFGKTLGTSTAPEVMKLDPHWTYVRFEFFDRQFGHAAHAHKRVNTPAMVIDGFRSTPPAAAPDTRSHWTIKDDVIANSVHCIPWVLQFQADRTAEPKPDTQIQLEFTNASPMHVISDSATVRRIAAATANDLKPGEKRLKFYDLPNKWKSKLYFTRYADNTGDTFENITPARIDAMKTSTTPLIFSLDDIVLTDATLALIVLAATEDPAIFFHQFKDPGAGFADAGKTFSPSGVYNPGADLTKQYFPYSNIVMTNRSYVSDYPNWVRLITAQGNLFDVFDRRMPDAANQVVGARAAVRWVDASTAAVGIQADGTVSPRPGRTPQPATDPSFVVQPFFCQMFDTNRSAARPAGKVQEWQTPAACPWQIGRFDIVLLRDCDVQGADASGNGGTENAINLHYFRFWLDFTNAGAPLNVAATQQPFRRDVVTNIPVRWNGPDGTNNPTAPLLKPEDATKLLQVGIKWFLQDLPSGKQHYHITIPNPIPVGARANMNGAFGTGSYTPGAQADDGTGWFTAAHECGHGDSLLDEYNERWQLCSYMERSFATWIDGDPYEDDALAMMNGNKQVRGRHYWHAVEFVRAATGLNFQLDHAGNLYKLPHHPNQTAADLRTFVNRPYVYEANVTGATGAGEGGRRKFDMYLYTLGNDAYARLPKPGQDLRGLLMIETKILVIFDDPNVTFRTVRDTVRDMARAVDTQFAGMVASAATVDGTTTDVSPCLLVFRPRFLVQTFPTNIANATDKGLQLTYCNDLGLAGVPNAEPAITQYLTNTAPGLYTTSFNTARTAHPEFFQVNVRSTYTDAWNGAVPGNAMKLHAAAGFAPFFGDMLGLDMTVLPPNAAVLKQRVQNRIVRRLMSNATVA